MLIAAFANRTPAIALRRSFVPEIAEHGVTGSIVESVGPGRGVMERDYAGRAA